MNIINLFNEYHYKFICAKKKKNSFNSAFFVCDAVGVADLVGSSLALTNRAQGPHNPILPF